MSIRMRGKIFLVSMLVLSVVAAFEYGCSSKEQATCQWQFTKGWNAFESNGSEWLKWSEGRGEVRVKVPQHLRNSEFKFKGELLSVHPENTIDVLVNDQKIKTLTLKRDKWEFKPLEAFSFSLKEGENHIVFVSQKEAVKQAADPRLLAIAFKNLELSAGSSVCELKKD